MSDPITVRRAVVADAAAFARVAADPAVYPGVLQLPFPSDELWRARLTESLAPTRNDLVLVAERGGEVVGHAGLTAVGSSPRRRHVMGLGMMVAGHAQHQGVGSALMTGLLQWADGWAQVLRIELTVYTDNAAGIALYRKFGFEVEGTLRAFALRDGRYADVLTMARLHPNPPTLP
jgi:L-phenylalanine/L-methionine N-acetyltransferase